MFVAAAIGVLVTMALALARRTSKILFIVANRAGLMTPALFAQQVTTFAAFSGGRIALNLVAGHSPAELRGFGDHLDHDARYERMDEYLGACRALWRGTGALHFRASHCRITGAVPGRSLGGTRAPLIYLGGNSPAARAVATRHADIWMRFPEHPDTLQQQIQPLLAGGLQVGLRMAVITRKTRAEALDYGCHLMSAELRRRKSETEQGFVAESDSHSIKNVFELARSEWLTPWVWLGAVRTWGAPCMTLLGSPFEVAQGIMAFRRAGIEHYILSGWPKQDAMVRFGREVIPLVRELEAADKCGRTTHAMAASGRQT